uniref:Uncharacterized protein n=1 Tax=Eutreptiella gymnastica TaxID=73025 RepID=A0A7S1NX93_9EUGL|mmetsp:Transcript_98260/g.169281  ORF Transcript_98260/g.169281 Transcript_98260/m.169281 type:complete len:121 (+) Transcript_98260:212-574(+)
MTSNCHEEGLWWRLLIKMQCYARECALLGAAFGVAPSSLPYGQRSPVKAAVPSKLHTYAHLHVWVGGCSAGFGQCSCGNQKGLVDICFSVGTWRAMLRSMTSRSNNCDDAELLLRKWDKG